MTTVKGVPILMRACEAALSAAPRPEDTHSMPTFAINHMTAPALTLDAFFALAVSLGTSAVEIRNDLDGNAIMELLGLPPGPLVGEAWRHLKELRLDSGPLSRDDAEAALRVWWAQHPKSPLAD